MSIKFKMKHHKEPDGHWIRFPIDALKLIEFSFVKAELKIHDKVYTKYSTACQREFDKAIIWEKLKNAR